MIRLQGYIQDYDGEVNRTELLEIAKPILFNTPMVEAILSNIKIETRRLLKPQPKQKNQYFRGFCMSSTDKKNVGCASFSESIHDGYSVDYIKPRYKVGDILYVRETWQYAYDLDGNDQIIEGTGRYLYAASPEDLPHFTYWVDSDTGEHKDYMPWRPSIHMSKKAARLFLRVTGVRVERLQDAKLSDFLGEGISLLPEAFNDPDNAYLQAKRQFSSLWNSTTKTVDLLYYGWDANPWVLVIKFERIILEG